MFEELEGIKEQIQFDQINPCFEDNLHRINNIIIPFSFFLKVYVIQKEFRFTNLGDQEN